MGMGVNQARHQELPSVAHRRLIRITGSQVLPATKLCNDTVLNPQSRFLPEAGHGGGGVCNCVFSVCQHISAP